MDTPHAFSPTPLPLISPCRRSRPVAIVRYRQQQQAPPLFRLPQVHPLDKRRVRKTSTTPTRSKSSASVMSSYIPCPHHTPPLPAVPASPLRQCFPPSAVPTWRPSPAARVSRPLSFPAPLAFFPHASSSFVPPLGYGTFHFALVVLALFGLSRFVFLLILSCALVARIHDPFVRRNEDCLMCFMIMVLGSKQDEQKRMQYWPVRLSVISIGHHRYRAGLPTLQSHFPIMTEHQG